MQKNDYSALWSFLIVFCLALLGWQILTTVFYGMVYPSLQVSPAVLAAHKKFQYILLLSGWVIPCALVFPYPSLPGRWRRIVAGIGVGSAISAAVYFQGIWTSAATCVCLAILLRRQASGSEESQPTPRRVWGSWILMLIFSGALFLAVKPRCDYRIIDLYDDGPKLAAVQDFMRGRQPYRDFVVHYGPIRDILQPLIAFRLWGVTYDSEQRIRAYVQAAGIALLPLITYAATRTLWWSLIVGFVFLMRNDLIVPERVTPVLLAAFFLCVRLRMVSGTRRAAWCVGALSGALSLAALLYSFEMGFTLIGGVIGTGILLKWTDRRTMDARPWRDWAAGLAIAFGLWCIILFAMGGLQPFLMDTAALLGHRLGTWADELSSHYFTFRMLGRPVHSATYVYLHAVPLFSLLVAGYVFWKRRNGEAHPRDGVALFLSAVLFVQYFIYMSRSDINHWQNATGLLWPLIALMLNEVLVWIRSSNGSTGFSRYWMLAGCAALWTILFPWLRGRTPLWVNTLNTIQSGISSPPRPADPPVVAERMGALPGSPEELATIQQMTRWIQAEVGHDEPLFLFMNLGGYYFLADRQNPTRYGLIDMVQGDRMLQECLRDLAAHPPKAVLVQLRLQPPHPWEYRPDLKPIADYLSTRYVPKHQIGQLVLLVPVKNSSKRPG